MNKAKIASIYKKLISEKRRRKTTGPKGRTLALQAASDRGRLLFSASFRRLQLKTQAFPQESNAAVRTRLTHSLEVASVGTYIAEGVAQRLLADGLLGRLNDPKSHNSANALITFVEVACLMHDLGNPPFGHFGEESIREWFSSRQYQFKSRLNDDELFDHLFKDFLYFDGNPQGFRMATRLQWVGDEFGYNLTLTQLAATLKYPWTPDKVGEKKDGSRIKKAGVFFSEADILTEVQRGLSLNPEARHPLTYLMEAADDISYCLSDIEDALEKRIIRNDDVIKALREALSKVGSRQAKAMLGAIPQAGKVGDDSGWFVRFRTTTTNELVKRACELYGTHHDDILRGEYFQLFERSRAANALLEVVRQFSNDHLYTCSVVRERELVGFQVVSGILDKFSLLLDLSTYDAVALLCQDSPGKVNGAALACTLKSLLPKKHLKVYQHEVKRLKTLDLSREKLDVLEWAARAHLIVDYLAGMTDEFSIIMYRRFYGGGGSSVMIKAYASHPVNLVPQWVNALGDGEWIASFSCYKYVPQTIVDKRERFKIPIARITPQWLEAKIAELPADSELALDSVLRFGRHEMHIPMVDFAADLCRRKEVIAWVAENLNFELQLFSSGRSYHAYGIKPVSRKKWVHLMGLLLLANMPDKPALIDTRWVGHRLLAGYSSLRWSLNSSHYLSIPTSLLPGKKRE